MDDNNKISLIKERIENAPYGSVIYGDYPDFDTIMNFISDLEQKINARP